MSDTSPTVTRAALWARRRRRLEAYGRWTTPFVDPTPAREHIHDLRTRYGLSADGVGHLAGLTPGIVEQITNPGHHQYRTTIRRETAAAILAARFDLAALPEATQVAAQGTQRRIRALARVGWSQRHLADRLGVTNSAVNSYLSPRRKRVATPVARAIAALYDELAMQPGPDAKAARWAELRNWPPPLAWDDDSIDDVNATPDGVPATNATRNGTGVVNADTLDDLATWGYTLQQAADRLGVTNSAIDHGIRRHAPHLRERFSHNATAQKEHIA